MDEIEHFPLPEGGATATETILRLIQSDPSYLDGNPYSEEDVISLKRMTLEMGIGESDDDLFIDEDEDLDQGNKWHRLEKETAKLYNDLTTYSQNLDMRDNAERMSYFRTATSLLDKIVGIQERAANLKQINLFHETVLNIMEDILDAGQRTEVMNRLKAAINPEATS